MVPHFCPFEPISGLNHYPTVQYKTRLSNSLTINRIEALSGDPLSWFDCMLMDPLDELRKWLLGLLCSQQYFMSDLVEALTRIAASSVNSKFPWWSGSQVWSWNSQPVKNLDIDERAKFDLHCIVVVGEHALIYRPGIHAHVWCARALAADLALGCVIYYWKVAQFRDRSVVTICLG